MGKNHIMLILMSISSFCYSGYGKDEQRSFTGSSSSEYIVGLDSENSSPLLPVVDPCRQMRISKIYYPQYQRTVAEKHKRFTRFKMKSVLRTPFGRAIRDGDLELVESLSLQAQIEQPLRNVGSFQEINFLERSVLERHLPTVILYHQGLSRTDKHAYAVALHKAGVPFSGQQVKDFAELEDDILLA